MAAVLLLGCVFSCTGLAAGKSGLLQTASLSAYCESLCRAEAPKGLLAQQAHSLENERSDASPCRSAAEAVGQEPADYLNSLGAYVIVHVEESLNVREEASSSAQKIASMENGALAQVLEIVKTDGSDWYRISSGSVEGYICSDYCLKGEEAITAAMAEIQPCIRVDTTAVNIRSCPVVAEGNIIGSASQDSVLILAQQQTCSSDWYAVEFEGRRGYVSSSYAVPGYYLPTAEKYYPSGSEARQMLVNYAMQFKGNPYIAGNENAFNGCDCSGLVRWCYREVLGIVVPHLARAQANYGKEISRSELQIGDLVFYDTLNENRVTHVAIYIGDGQVLHALNTRVGIVVTSIDFNPPIRYVNLIDYPPEN